jgi:phage gp46-like protein
MKDVAIRLNSDGEFDIAVSGGDLVSDDGLETAVAISLFSNARVSDSELPQGVTSKAGWFGDLLPDDAGSRSDQIGSKLWTLDREKRIPETLRKFEDYSKEALAWMISDGVAETVETSASFTDNGQVKIDIQTSHGTKRNKYTAFWDGQALKSA